MAQIFHRGMNTLARASILGAMLLVGGLGWAAHTLDKSSYNTEQGLVRDQPVPFSHEHHVAGLGIHCVVCHASVEDSAFAGIPPTKTCMTCHSQIWSNAEVLKPVRDSWVSGRPIEWNRVHNLPDFVYFNHGIHVAKGVACASCHGQVDRMPLTYQAHSLTMSWCLDCHRAPENYIRPRERVYDMHFDLQAYLKETGQPAMSQQQFGETLVKEYDIKKAQLTNCSICHR